MIDELISYKTAVVAKELGFDIPCFHIFSLFRGKITECGGAEDLESNDSLYKTIHKNVYYKRYSTLDNHFLAPTQSLLHKWIREKYNLVIEIQCPDMESEGFSFCTHKKHKTGGYCTIDKEYETYEEALEDGLYYTIIYILKQNFQITI